MESLKLDEFCFEDYYQISQNERCELIFGEIVMMASPSDFHQLITGNIFNILKNRMKAKKNPCLVRISPYDIKLKKGESENVVQPDVMVFCKKRDIKKETNNIPTVIFEVTSPSTSKNDYSSKKELYEIFGIKEYYIISSEYKTVQKFVLKKNKLQSVSTFVENQKFTIDVLEEEIVIKELFEE